MEKKRLIIIDVSNFIFRAFFAIRVLHSPEGVPVNAVHGVLSMFLKLFAGYRPTHVLLAKDTSGGSFRNEMYDKYKANRSEPPEDLIPQFALIKTLFEHMNLKSVENQKYEADDLIGSACVQWKDDFDEILIASGDKDLMQFVEGNVKMVDTMKDVVYGRDEVFAKMGVWPEQIVDYLSMVGDASDNIPGMRGIGAKGAAKLLAEHTTLDGCIAVKDTFKGKKLTTAFGEYLEAGLLSKELVQIVTDIDLTMTATETEYSFYPSDELINYLKGLGFKSAIKKLEDLRFNTYQAEQNTGEEAPIFQKSFSEFKLEKINSISDVEPQIKTAKQLSFVTEFDGENPVTQKISSLAISFDGKTSFYCEDQLVCEELVELIYSKDIELITEHGKRDSLLVSELAAGVKFFDITQAHYVLQPQGKHDFDFVCDEILAQDIQFKQDEDLSNFLGERAVLQFFIAEKLKEKLKETELLAVYDEIDEPLLNILARMEQEGVIVNSKYLQKMEKDLSVELEKIKTKINTYSLSDVNLNSPKQVSEFLFEELSLPVIKKTKTGFSTDSEVLESLVSMNVSEVPAMILKYREISKILSTYVKAIPALINPETKKVHTHFNAHNTATGRLSSNNPNLQNIPIRSELGRQVRKAFVATPGNILLSADYSQVELRILAHFSNDTIMIESFKNGVDIHVQTASEVLGKEIGQVTSNERSHAKAVNFGLMYGQSSFGLSKALKISRSEAKDYITKYFERFNKVKSFLDSLKEKCEIDGFAITYHGRKRYLPDINSQNRTIKANAERIAVNSPMQGTASDIIKLAMIKIDSDLKEQNLKSKMILQVHDELIFDVPEDELSIMKELVRSGMEDVVELKVPLTVDQGVGVNWFDLK